MIDDSPEYEEFLAQIRSIVLEYKPTLRQLMGAISRLDKLLSGLPLEPRPVEAPPREGEDL